MSYLSRWYYGHVAELGWHCVLGGQVCCRRVWETAWRGCKRIVWCKPVLPVFEWAALKPRFVVVVVRLSLLGTRGVVPAGQAFVVAVGVLFDSLICQSFRVPVRSV